MALMANSSEKHDIQKSTGTQGKQKGNYSAPPLTGGKVGSI
jgi:hypothetical protein